MQRRQPKGHTVLLKVFSFHVQAESLENLASGNTGKSRAGTAGPSRTIAFGTSAPSGFPGTGSHGVPRISLNQHSVRFFARHPASSPVHALMTPSRVPVTTSPERSCTPRNRLAIQRSSRRDTQFSQLSSASPSQRRARPLWVKLAIPDLKRRPRRLLEIFEPPGPQGWQNPTWLHAAAIAHLEDRMTSPSLLAQVLMLLCSTTKSRAPDLTSVCNVALVPASTLLPISSHTSRSGLPFAGLHL